MVAKRNPYRILVEDSKDSKGTRPPGTPRHFKEGNIKIDLRGIGWDAWTVLIGFRTGTGRGLL
jgi:hypothetical protein